MGIDRGFNSAMNRREFGFNFCRDFCHDRATIGLRSGIHRGASALSIASRLIGDESPTIARQNLLDRGSIVEFFHDVPPPLD